MNRYYLNADNAHRIAEGIMKVIPCNISITDAEGAVLAGGDAAGPGLVHQGAITAIKRKEPYVVCLTDSVEQREVSQPIICSRSILGAIVIRGEGKEVMSIARICMSMAVLMIENQQLSEMSSVKESRLRHFLCEWTGMTEEACGNTFYEQASVLGIDLTIPRTAVIMTGSKICFSTAETIRGTLADGEYLVVRDRRRSWFCSGRTGN